MSIHRLACLSLLLIAFGAQAGDEDMSPSAYHVFDPETGYMVTVDPMAEEQPLENGDDAPAAAESATATDQAAPPWLYGAGALVVLGALIGVLYRRRGKT